MNRPSRRTAALASATLAVALVAGVTAAVVLRDRPGGTSALSPLDVPREVVPEQAVHSPTPSPSPTASPRRSRPTATRSPTPEPSTAFGPRLPGSVAAPYRPGQTSWDVVSNGFRIRVTTEPGRQGTPTTWTVSASSARAKCCVIYLNYGDGFGATPQMDCEHPASSVSYSHIYNRPGKHEFLVQVRDPQSCANDPDGVLYAYLDVAAGSSTAQGPELPVVQFDNSAPLAGHEEDFSYVTVYGEAFEEDGWITKLVVTFGDGTTKTFGGDTNPEGCHLGPDGWPTGSRATLPHDPYAYHHYSEPGTYTLTMTAYSAGCDGSMVQTGKASFDWEVP